MAATEPAQCCIVVETECVVTWAGLTEAKWPALWLPRPGQKTKYAPFWWFGVPGAGGHPELRRVTGGTRGGTRPEASGFSRSFQVRQTNRGRLLASSKLACARPASSLCPRARETEVQEGHPVNKGRRTGESPPEFLKS